MDPTDYFIYDEFLNTGMKYECQNCGTHFGDECVVRDETQCVAVCPACGAHVIDNEDG